MVLGFNPRLPGGFYLKNLQFEIFIVVSPLPDLL
jgi:hypothetical protein